MKPLICARGDPSALIAALRTSGLERFTLHSVCASRDVEDDVSIDFSWIDVNSELVLRRYCAKAWADDRDGEQAIRCFVRRAGASDDSFIRAPTTKSLAEFVEMLDSSPWDDWVPIYTRHSPKPEREAARQYKRSKAIALSTMMAFHPRLGRESAIACLGADLIRDLLLRMLACARQAV